MPPLSTNNPDGLPFIELISIDSTNNYAMQLVNKGLASNGTVVFAHEQTAGKGQRGKQWKSLSGFNIMMSLVLNVNSLPVSRQFVLSAAVALTLREFFDEYSSGDCKIKWPNDLYWRDRKAGGVLIENIIRGQEWQWTIIGIGININQVDFDPSLPNPVSLRQITGQVFNTVDLAKALQFRLYKRLLNLAATDDVEVLQAYNNQLYKIGEPVRLRRNNILFDCVIKNVNGFGQLIVQNEIEQAFNVGDVDWVILS